MGKSWLKFVGTPEAFSCFERIKAGFRGYSRLTSPSRDEGNPESRYGALSRLKGVSSTAKEEL